MRIDHDREVASGYSCETKFVLAQAYDSMETDHWVATRQVPTMALVGRGVGHGAQRQFGQGQPKSVGRFFGVFDCKSPALKCWFTWRSIVRIRVTRTYRHHHLIYLPRVS